MFEKREVIHQKLRRCFNWDYRRPGSYAITLTLADRSRDWLGRLITDEQARPHEGAEQARAHEGAEQARPHEGAEQARAHEGARGWAIELSPLGEIVANCWRDLAANWPGVEPREFQVMPEHFHGILRVTTPQRHPLGQIIGSFKAKATAAAREYGETLGQARAHVGPLVPASLLGGIGLFSPGLQDTILWDLKRYRNERDYLLANPARLAVKRAHPELFRVVRDLAVELAPGRGHFSAIGNHFLLQKTLFQVQCSRRDFGYAFSSTAFAAKRDAALLEAAKGAVLISPCVSDGERQIAREALAAGLPLITLQNKGFSPFQKPSGRYFDACAAGRLLMLAPAAWPYLPGHKPMTRDDATAMNRLCQWLAGEDAAEINYHGLRPANIDAFAKAAALIN